MSSSPPLNQNAVLVQIRVSDIPFVLGYILNFGLLGVLSNQVYVYARHFRRDPRWLRSIVFFVFFLEVFNSVLVVYSAIFGANIRCLSCIITGQRDYVLNGVPVSKTLSIWAFQALCALTGLSSSIVQVFFAWRIWILGRSAWVPVVVILISLAQCVVLTTGGIMSSTDPNLGVFDTNGAVIWLIISAMCDILITVRTTQLLFRSQDRSNFQATQSLVRKLVKMTIETGLVTVIATLLEFAIAQTLNIAHHGVFYFLSKLYANCLLTSLNARLAIYEEAKFDPSSTGLFSPTIFGPVDAPLCSADTFRRHPHALRPGLHKTLSGPGPVPSRDSTPIPTARYYRSAGVQSAYAYTGADGDTSTRWGGGDVETALATVSVPE